MWILAGGICFLFQGHCMFGHEVRGQQYHARMHSIAFFLVWKFTRVLRNSSNWCFNGLHQACSEKSFGWYEKRITSLIDLDFFFFFLHVKFSSIPKMTEWKTTKIRKRYWTQKKYFISIEIAGSILFCQKNRRKLSFGWLVWALWKYINIQTIKVSHKN